MDFDNLHQVLRNLYQEMMPLCGDMIGVAKGIAGLGALFYVAYRVWKALANAEPIDVFPLLRPFAIGLCVMFFPTVVLGTINAVMSPVVQGTHAILEGQTLDLQAYQQQKDDLEAEARRREGKAWLVDDEVYEQRLADMGITDLGEIISMWAERTWYDIKAGFRQLVRDFFELLFNAAGLTIDTLRTFFLVVLSILGPLSFALSIYDGFHSTLASWISRYISVYLWLPIADLFSAVLAKIQTLMLQADVLGPARPQLHSRQRQRCLYYLFDYRYHRLFHDPHRCRVGDPVGRSRRGYGRYQQGRGIRHGCRWRYRRQHDRPHVRASRRWRFLLR